jgi:hypothetical protein
VREHREREARNRRRQDEREIVRRGRDGRRDVVPDDRDVAVGIAAEDVQIRDGVLLFLRLRLPGRELREAYVVERVVGAPGRRADEVGATDRVGEDPSGARLDDVDRRVLGTAFGDPVGDVLPVERREEVVDREVLVRARRELVGIDEEVLRRPGASFS